MTRKRPLHLAIGLEVAGQAGLDRAGWNDLVARLDGLADLLTLEDGFADSSGDGLDAILLANWLAPRSRRIGLIAGATLNFLEPFHVSTGIATLDYASEGRAGLLVQRLGRARRAEAAKANGTLQGFPDPQHHDLGQDTDDAIEVIRRLWDSWEDDAVIRDPASQRFVDGARLHYIDFRGEGFSVLGPSITPRPPQGQPVIAASWSPGEDDAFARQADLVFLRTEGGDLARAVDELKGAAAGPLLLADIDDTEASSLTAHIEAAAGFDIAGVRLVLRDPAQAGHLVEAVIAPLLAAGVIAPPAGGTLRSRLGLPDASNRYALAG
ncbi:LLM class flavin-dependent oxidoreductase [Labrys neptuniae]